MTKDCFLKYNNLISIGIILFIGLNILVNVLNLLSDMHYYRGLLFIELVLVGYLFVFCRKIKIKKNGIELVFLIVIMQLLAYIFTLFLEAYNCFDIHRLLVFLSMIVVLFFVPQYAYIDKKYFDKLLSGILVLSFLASIYNIFNNWSVLSSFNIVQIMYYTSQFTAFFNTRSNFCLLLCISCAICMLRMKQKKGIYFVLLCFFLANILLTNARTSIIVMTALIVFEIWKGTKKRTLIVVLAILIMMLFPWSTLFSGLDDTISKYSLLFTRGEDFSNGRFQLLAEAWRNTNIVSFFIGHGIGSKDTFLTYIGSSIFSFHSMWVDLFFEGGILLLLIYLYFVVYVLRKVKKSKLKCEVKQFFYNLFFIIAIAGFGDAIATPFLLDTSSILSTILLFTCPLSLINGIELEVCEKINTK